MNRMIWNSKQNKRGILMRKKSQRSGGERKGAFWGYRPSNCTEPWYLYKSCFVTKVKPLYSPQDFLFRAADEGCKSAGRNTQNEGEKLLQGRHKHHFGSKKTSKIENSVFFWNKVKSYDIVGKFEPFFLHDHILKTLSSLIFFLSSPSPASCPLPKASNVGEMLPEYPHTCTLSTHPPYLRQFSNTRRISVRALTPRPRASLRFEKRLNFSINPGKLSIF